MDIRQMTVVCSGKIREAALAKLADKVQLLTWQQGGRVPAATLAEWLAKADALYSIANLKIDAQLLAQAPHLKVVGQASVGYDNIDLQACQDRHVRVGNTPGVLVDAVADLAYGLLLDTARNITRGDRHVKSGAWGQRKGLGFGVDLAGKTLGIVGMGSIGSAVVKRARASGLQVIYHNRHENPQAKTLQVPYVNWEELLTTADFVLCCVNLNPSTVKLFNAAAFAKMKDGVRFVNISRGKVVDTEALVAALESGKVAAAGLDVTDPEPLPGDHPLTRLNNVTITPHIASSTLETRDAMAVLTAENILAALQGLPMPAEVKIKD
ncbi:MAG: D-glycerate dehydrogenase [Acidaminococcaceae bacterium]|jgi:glyoxylate reductase|nr:D-glycerate dehydrogenase [Acidaminococcaceae bacterium]